MTTPSTEAKEGLRPTGARNRVTSTPSNRPAAAYHSDQSPARPSTRKADKTPNPHRHNPNAQHSGQQKKQHGGKKMIHSQQTPQNLLDGQGQAPPNLRSPSATATPLKQAYAGPTFHSSPAASSLPLPSFFTRSLPTVTASPPSKANIQLDGEATTESEGEPGDPVQATGPQQAQREPSPLDFMFDAARRARDTPKSQSPAHGLGRLSPFDETPRAGSRTPGDTSSDTGFPFELDGNGGTMPIGPAFATPYRDRMAALKSSHSEPNNVPQFLDEKERREKSEALKRLLVNASPLGQSSGSISTSFYDHLGNPFSAPLNQTQIYGNDAPRPVSAGHWTNPPVQDTPSTLPVPEPPFRSGSSRLSREYFPDNQHVPAELDSDPGTPSRMAPRSKKPIVDDRPNEFQGHPTQAEGVSRRMKSSYSSQELEDDLRRVLKLDLTPSK